MAGSAGALPQIAAKRSRRLAVAGGWRRGMSPVNERVSWKSRVSALWKDHAEGAEPADRTVRAGAQGKSGNWYPDPLPVLGPAPTDPTRRVLTGGWDRVLEENWKLAVGADAISAHWTEFLERVASPAPFGPGIDGGMTDDVPGHNTVVSFAYCAALAAGGRSRVSFLDWGGGIGQFGRIAKAALPGVEVDYVCVDVPETCRRGRELDPSGVYLSDTSWKDRRYDLVMASGSIQSVEDWRSLLGDLARATKRYLLVTRLPIVSRAASFVVAQKAYGTEYPGWILNRDELLDAAAWSGMRIVREFLVGDGPGVGEAPERFRWRGFLFAPSGR